MHRFYSSKRETEPRNNELHEAILERDIRKCLDIIRSVDTSAAVLNHCSLGNSPAMLALKTGLIDVAFALIEDERVDLQIADKRGFSLLHFACFLREDALITALLNRKAMLYQVDEFSSWPPETFPFRRSAVQNTKPFRLYSLTIRAQYFPEEIIDSDGFCVFPLILTDLLFHMDKLCLNYKLKQEDDFTEADKIPASSRRFSQYAAIGLQDFINMRNEKPLNEDILQSLGEEHLFSQRLL